jgi:hypothetical protein
MKTRQNKIPNKEVLTRCGDAQFAGMNTTRQKKESLLNSCQRTGPVRYAAHRKMHLRRYLKKHKEKAMAFNRGDLNYYIPVLRDGDMLLPGIDRRRCLKQPVKMQDLYFVPWL